MNYNIPCPVCHKTLQSFHNPNILTCDPYQYILDQTDDQVEAVTVNTVHATYCVGESGVPILKIIEIPPFNFEIHENVEQGFYQTRIQKILPPKGNYYGRSLFTRETLLILPGAISCPWHDQKAVFDKIKLLMLFS